MEILIMCWALAYAIVGAWNEGKTSATQAAGRAATATAGRARTGWTAAGDRIKNSNSRTAGILRGTGTALGHTGRGVKAATLASGRGIRSAWRPLARGARQGWVKGRERGRERVAGRGASTGTTTTGTGPDAGQAPPRPWRSRRGTRATGTESDPGESASPGESATATPGATPSESPTATPGESPGASGGESPDPERVRATATRVYPEPPQPTPVPPFAGPALPAGGDGPAASHDPNRPEPTDTSKPILEGTIVSAPAIGSGESTTYEQTCINAAAFLEAAGIHLDRIGSMIAEAEAVAEANRILADNLAEEDMDAAAEAAQAADAADAAAAYLRGAQSLFDQWSGNLTALSSKLEEHQGVADAIRARSGGAANRTDYYV